MLLVLKLIGNKMHECQKRKCLYLRIGNKIFNCFHPNANDDSNSLIKDDARLIDKGKNTLPDWCPLSKKKDNNE